IKWRHHSGDHRVHLRVGDLRYIFPCNVGGHTITSDAAEYRRARHTVATEAGGSMHTGRILAGHAQPGEVPVTGGIDLYAAHQVMGRRANFYWLTGEVEAHVTAALHHAGEIVLDQARPEMGHVDIDATMRAATTGDDLQIGTAGDDVARRTLQSHRVILLHIPFQAAIEQVSANTAEALF